MNFFVEVMHRGELTWKVYKVCRDLHEANIAVNAAIQINKSGHKYRIVEVHPITPIKQEQPA